MVVVEDKIKLFIDDNYEEFMKKHMGMEGPFKVVSEYPLGNGQLVDKVIIGTNNKVLALIECKGEVGTNEFVRGFGQTYQGNFHITKNFNGNISDNAKSLLVMPIEVKHKIPFHGVECFSEI